MRILTVKTIDHYTVNDKDVPEKTIIGKKLYHITDRQEHLGHLVAKDFETAKAKVRIRFGKLMQLNELGTIVKR